MSALGAGIRTFCMILLSFLGHVFLRDEATPKEALMGEEQGRAALSLAIFFGRDLSPPPPLVK